MYIVAWLWACVTNKSIQLLNKRTGIDQKIRLMTNILSDSPLDCDLLYSYINSKDMLISLSNRKVYVGTVVSMGEPNESEGMDQEISLLPSMSGYRDTETLAVTFNTHYSIIDKDIDIRVTIRQDLIESVSRFDYEVYKIFLLERKANEKAKKSLSESWRKVF